jgi:hypothetical protein
MLWITGVIFCREKQQKIELPRQEHPAFENIE